MGAVFARFDALAGQAHNSGSGGRRLGLGEVTRMAQKRAQSARSQSPRNDTKAILEALGVVLEAISRIFGLLLFDEKVHNIASHRLLAGAS
jgi:hypothetical protein